MVNLVIKVHIHTSFSIYGPYIVLMMFLIMGAEIEQEYPDDCDNVFDSYFCHCLCNIWPSCILYVVASNLVFASGSEFVTTHPVGLLLFALLHAFRGGSRFLLFIYIFFSHACVRVLRTVYGTEIEPETESVNKNKKYIHAPAMAALLKNSIGILFICWLWNFPQDFPIMKWGLPRCWIGER